MVEVLGVALFAVGILLSLVLHEAGHMGAARAFGMKVTRFFVGYGRTLCSFRRGETEYGVKAIPAGAFVKIVGMVRQDDDVDPEDEPRAMWRFPVWRRTTVMAAGAATNVAFGVFLLWGLFAFVPLPDEARLQSEPVRVAAVSECVPVRWSADLRCAPGTDPASAAARLGLRPGDVITAVDGQAVRGWDELTARVRAAGGRTIDIGYERDGQSRTGGVAVPLVERARPGGAATDREWVGVLGVTPRVPESAAGPIGAVGATADQTGFMVEGTFAALTRLPERVPALWASLTGAERDPDTPISMVGASRIGGELADQGEWPSFVVLLAGLNFFLAVFNLLPLLPLDGGHIAIAWFERARSIVYARLRRPDPGSVDYYRLMPLTYVVILIFGAFTLLTVTADLVNPITLS